MCVYNCVYRFDIILRLHVEFGRLESSDVVHGLPPIRNDFPTVSLSFPTCYQWFTNLVLILMRFPAGSIYIHVWEVKTGYNI